MPDLYPYQADAVACALAEFDCGRDALVVMPTGTGKTYVYAAVARGFAKRKRKTLVLAHRGELLDQGCESLDAFGLTYEVEKADQRARKRSLFTDVVVASVQTMQKDRLLGWPPDTFELVVVDESHHALAKSWLAVLRHFHRARKLYLTATPERGDGQRLGKLGNIAELPCFEYPLAQAIDEGFLCKFWFETLPTAVDLSRIRTTGSDLSKADLEREISPHIEQLVNATKQKVGDRPTIVFTPDVGSADAFADGLRKVGVTARSVSGDSPDRSSTIAAFKRNDFQALACCQLATEGFDHKPIAAVVLARPTKSGVLFRQMVGRGLRTAPGKEDCMIVDFAWNCGEHAIVTPIELFDTSGMDAEVLAVANELVRKYPRVDPLRTMRQAEKIHKQRVAFQVAVKERQANFRWVAHDPFAIGSLLGVPRRRRPANARPLTPALKRRLAAHKLESGDMTAREAERLLEALDDRRGKGLATHRQVATLVGKGVDPDEARSLGFREASDRLTALGLDRRRA